MEEVAVREDALTLSFNARRGSVLRSISINNFRLSEEKYASNIQTLGSVYKSHFVHSSKNDADPLLSDVDISFIFFSTSAIEDCSQRLLELFSDFNENDSVCDVLYGYFNDEMVQEAFLQVILASTRSFEHLSKLLLAKPDLRKVLDHLTSKTVSKDTLGSLIGALSQRIHCYIPLIEEIEENTPLQHRDMARFATVKSMIETFITSLPVVSKIGITNVLDIISEIETEQIVKLPRSGLTKTKLNSELIAEGIMYEISIRSGVESREKCYVLLLINKIICIPFDKIARFKHSFVEKQKLDAIASSDIKWFASLADCSFKSVPSYFLKAAQGASTKENRSAQSLKVSGHGNKELFVVNETCVTNIEPYVIQEERYLIADKDSPKDHLYWSNSFKIAQRYTLHLQVSFVTTIADQITALEQCCQTQMLTSSQWKMLAKHGDQKTFKQGKIILTQGEAITKLYWLQRGSATVTKRIGNTIVSVGIIQKYNLFGEIGYLSSSSTVSATVIANSDAVLCSLDYHKLFNLFQKYPKFAVDFFKLMCTQIALELMSTSYSCEYIIPASRKPQTMPRNRQLTQVATDLPTLLSNHTSKEYKDVLKSVGLPLSCAVLFGSSCKLSTPRKKTHNATVLCLENMLILYSKSFGSSYHVILNLQSLNPPENESSAIHLTSVTDDTRYSLTFRNEQRREQFLQVLEEAKSKLMTRVSQSHPSNIIPEQNTNIPILPEEDWYSLLAKAETLKFVNGEVIVRQGDRIDKLYQIYDGTCDVYIEQKTVKGSTYEVMESLVAGDKFGETGFAVPLLCATASIVVTSERLEVLAISRNVVMDMYRDDLKLEYGLYCYIAQQLAERFIKRQNVVSGLRGSMQFALRKKSRREPLRPPQIRWENGLMDGMLQPSLVATVNNYHVEFGNFNVPQKDRTPCVDDIARDYSIFATDFLQREHVSLIGYSMLEDQFVAISLCLKQYIEDVKVIVLIRRETDGVKLIKFALPNETTSLNCHTTIPILKHRIPELLNYHFYQVSEDRMEEISKDFIMYENNEITREYKFGLLYQTQGQRTETEIYSTEHISPDLLELMVTLGNFVQLDGWEGFSGGLDVSGKNITGPTSLFCNLDNFYDIMFHVSPFIPCEPNDEQRIGRKRHLGNDMVVLVYSDSDVPFDPSGFNSHFNHCFIVVKKLPVGAQGGPTSYHVETICKKSVPFVYRPILPSPPVIPKNEIKQFLLTKLINAQRMTMKTEGFEAKTVRTRRYLLENYAKKYAPHLSSPPSQCIRSPRSSASSSLRAPRT